MNRDADDVAANIIQVADSFAYAKTAARAKKADIATRRPYFRAASTTSPLEKRVRLMTLIEQHPERFVSNANNFNSSFSSRFTGDLAAQR
jgi:hypothetical protein